MKTCLFTSLLLLFGAFNVHAQQGSYGQHQHGGGQQSDWQQQSPDDKAKAFVSKLGEKVDVTQPQKDSIQFIYKKFFTDLQTYKIQDNPEIFDELKTKRDDAVKRILADDTKLAAYRNFLASMKQHAQDQGINNDNQQGNWHHGQGDNDQDQSFPDQNTPH